jgi:hypothetical protein
LPEETFSIPPVASHRERDRGFLHKRRATEEKEITLNTELIKKLQ